MPPAFPKEEFDQRQQRLRALMDDHGLDVCVITTPENICYLTGHETPGYYVYQALVVPKDGDPVIVLRESEVINAEEFTYLDRFHGFPDSVDPVDATLETIRSLGPASRFGIEEKSWFLPPALYQRLVAGMGGAEPTHIDQSVADLRLLKSSSEIERLREASEVVNAAAEAAIELIAPGVRERDVAAAIFSALTSAGSEYLGMEPFVASGPRSGSIHASWTDREIQHGEPVLIEFAAARSRYHSVLMHTVATGELPDDLAALADTCHAARAATIEQIRPGATPEQCHEACVETIRAAGLGDYYRKRTGYSVGLAFAPDWGEGHLLSLGYGQTRPLEAGMVLHAVPAIRMPGRGGFGLSATVLVTEDGHEVLTKAPGPYGWAS